MAKDFSICLLFELYKGMLTEKQQEAFVNYYYDDLSLAEISENTGISRQGARDAIKRSEEILLDTEKRLGFLKKSKESNLAFSQIGSMASESKEAFVGGNSGRALELLLKIETVAEKMNGESIWHLNR